MRDTTLDKVKLCAGFGFTAFIAVLSSCLLTSPALAQEWVLKVDSDWENLGNVPDHSSIYQFRNGDRLIVVDDHHVAMRDWIHHPNVYYAVPNQKLDAPIEKPHLDDEDLKISNLSPSPRTSQQNGFAIAGFDRLSDSQRQCDASRVAVLDSGVDMTHKGLAHVQFVAPYDARNQAQTVIDEFGHGTHVSGILTGQGVEHVFGACTTATIMPIRFLGANGGGNISDAVKGVQWAINHSADIINHSWSVTLYSQPLFDVLNDADQRGIIQVAAAGNFNYDTAQRVTYPASFSTQIPQLISVGNWSDSLQSLSANSNYSWSNVDIAAPGTDITSLYPLDNTNTQSGTSMAAPWISAAMAMVKQQNPSWSAAQVVATVLQSGQEKPNNLGYVRSGLLFDAAGLLQEQPALPLALAFTRQQGELTLHGHRLNEVATVRFVPAISSIPPRELTVNRQSSSQLMVSDWDFPAGWFELITVAGEKTRYGVTPVVPAPTDVEVQALSQGQLLTWNGLTYADEYIVYRQEGGTYRQIAVVTAPTNQYLDQGESDRIYKVKARYQAKVGNRVITLESLQSAASSLDTGIWQSHILGSIPKGSFAEIPVLSNNANASLRLQDDPQNMVKVWRNGVMEIDTSTVRSGSVSIVDRSNDAVLTMNLTVAESERWRLPVSGHQVEAYGEQANVFSMQGLSDGGVHLTGQWQSPESALHFVLDSVSHQFTEAEIRSLENAKSANVQVGAKTITVTPSQAISSATDFSLTLSTSISQPTAKASSDDSRCFIASSVYSKDAPQLAFYRDIRDDVLLKLPFGEVLVSQYYQSSPELVVLSNAYPILNDIAFYILDLIYFLVNTWMWGCVFIFSLIFIGFKFKQKMNVGLNFN